MRPPSFVVRVVVLLSASVLLASCASQDQKKSIEMTNEGVKAYNAKQYDIAVTKLKEAGEVYKNNHTAHYNLGQAYDALKRWKEAAESYEKAVKLSGKDAMYHMKHGIARYKAILEEGKVRQAKLEEKDPSEIDANSLDLQGANFDPALAELEAAVAINADLFRAYYYIGRIRRHQDDAQKAAEAFTKSIEANPREADPYVALGELYRRWDYSDEAVKVLGQGKANVIGDKDRPELLFAYGMAYMDKKDYEKAIPEFTEALDLDKNLHRAKYARGLARFRTQEYKGAKEDLEQYQKSAKDEFTKGVASKTLMDIMAKQL